MAISLVNPPYEVPPVLLHYWQEIMLESPWHFNGVLGNDAPLNEPCPVYVQPDRDFIGRQLYNAYSQVRSALSYDPLPMWHSEKVRLGNGVPWQWQSLRLKWMKLKAFGTRAASVIQADAAVTYSKSDAALAADDTATITVATTLTDADEIQVFFRTADGAANAADARWQIVPLTVTFSGGNAVITGHRSLFVKPSIWKSPYIGVNQTTRHEAVTTDAADFVTQVDVYRIYPDATNAVTLTSDPLSAWCASTPLNTSVTQAALGWIEQDDESVFRIRLDRGVCLTAYPQYVFVNYLAGEEWQYQQMDNELAQAIIHLANTLMPQKPCEICNQANSSWQEDVNMSVKRASGTGGWTGDEKTPFGMQIGAHRAWQIVKERRIIRGGKLTG